MKRGTGAGNLVGKASKGPSGRNGIIDESRQPTRREPHTESQVGIGAFHPGVIST